MKDKPFDPPTRRQFLRQASLAGGLALVAPLAGCVTQNSPDAIRAGTTTGPASVAILFDPSDTLASSKPVQWALNELADALIARGVSVNGCRRPEETAATVCIIPTGPAWHFPAIFDKPPINLSTRSESVALGVARKGRQTFVIAGGADELGLVYALTELADRVKHAPNPIEALTSMPAISESPANSIRGVMRLISSDVEDLGWFNDRSFWKLYLSTLVSQRFNRFNLALGLGYDNARGVRDTYFFFAYPFLVSPKGYNVRATPLSDAERDRNLQMLRFISDEAAARGLHFQLGLWTHAYQWIDSPNANYVIEGLTPEQHGPYCRDALHTLLDACPNIHGVTFRIHGESGVNEGSYDFWKTVYDGVVRTGRPLQIDMHAKGMDQRMIDTALATGLPITIAPKYWAEHFGLPYHQASIRELEMPKGRPTTGQFALSSGSRSFLRYGYGDLLRDDRKFGIIHRIWPGTQRLLLSADPKFVAGYGRAFSFSGSDGVEFFDPLSFKGRQASGLPGGRGAYRDEILKPAAGDWQKYLLTYRLWGRLTYNPDADADVWQRAMRTDFGDDSAPLEASLATASRILPLVTTAHCPSAANFNYWPEMYTNQSIVDPAHPGPYSDSTSPKVFGNVSPLDPQLFATANEFASALLGGKPLAKVSPIEVAQQLENWSTAATPTTRPASDNPSTRRARVDVAILSSLGLFFAKKFRSAVLFGLFDQTGYEPARQAALACYREARGAWAGVVRAADGVYVDDITFGPPAHLRGTWSDRLPAIDADIVAMAQAPSAYANGPVPATDILSALIALAQTRPTRSSLRCDHQPAESFRGGEALTVDMHTDATTAHLWYRRLDQEERWASVEMTDEQGKFTARIPADYTATAYPIQYYFELRDAQGMPRLHPGFGDDFTGQPYFVMRHAKG